MDGTAPEAILPFRVYGCFSLHRNYTRHKLGNGSASGFVNRAVNVLLSITTSSYQTTCNTFEESPIKATPMSDIIAVVLIYPYYSMTMNIRKI